MFFELFPRPKPVIGMIALPPLPGCKAYTSIEDLIECALFDLAALEQGGVDAVLVENDFDDPRRLTVGPEGVAAMTRVTHEVVARAHVPVGVQVLLNDWRASLAVAALTGARFVRLDFFVDRVRIKAGPIEPEPEAVLAYRAQIGASHVALFTDIQVKYSELIDGPKPMELSAAQALAAGSDALIITGSATGIQPAVEDLLAARQGAGKLPILIGSGTTPENAGALLPHVDGAIIGTALRAGPTARDRVDEMRVARLVAAKRAILVN